jgi:hypothetical protein
MKIKINGKLSLKKEKISMLNGFQMSNIIGGLNLAPLDPAEAEGPARSKRLDGDCNYSRQHYTQCCEGERYSRPSICTICSPY